MKPNLKAALAIAGVATAGVVVYKQFARRKYSGFKIKRSIIVDRPRIELYRFWRDFRNLPHLMESLESVEQLDNRRSRWTMKSAAGIPVTWDAEITLDRDDEMIGWRSVEGSSVETAGYVKFLPASGGRGTVVHVALEYFSPAGYIGAGAAMLFGKSPAFLVEQSLRRFKQLFEAGEVATAAMRSPYTDVLTRSFASRQIPTMR